MKNTFFVLLSLLISNSAHAQNTDQALARVHYKFMHMRDTTERDQFFEENMVLITGRNAAVYLSYDRLLQSDRLANFLKEQTKANGGTLTNIVMQKGIMKSVSSTDYYTFANEKKAFSTEYMNMNKYLIPDDLAPVKWSIEQDTIDISGLSCRKALTNLKVEIGLLGTLLSCHL